MQTRNILSLAILLTGCAGVSHKPIPYTQISGTTSADAAIKANASADEKAKGIRYYQTSPYLLVYSDGKGGIGWKIYYLPDQTRKMSAEPYNFLSKVKADLTFSNGMLTDSTADIDATTLPKGIISAVEKLLPSLLAAADQPPHEIPPPRLYKIVVKGGEIILAGSPGDRTIRVTGTTGN